MSDKKPKSEADTEQFVPIIPDESDPPKADHKNLGGGDRDAWNHLMMFSALDAQPRSHNGSEKEKHDQARALWAGMADINPADPIEGIIIAQLMAANQASLTMYQRAWAQPNEYFEARTRYLALADKAARTVVLLTERLDHHRGRGQQKIIVQHVTTNNVTADQAVITDSLVTNGVASNPLSPALLTANAGTPMPALDETKQPRLVGVGVGKEKE